MDGAPHPHRRDKPAHDKPQLPRYMQSMTATNEKPKLNPLLKLKPTIIYALFGGILIGGYILEKPFLTILFDSMFHLTAEGWRKLTLRWALFFLALAVLNEAIWRTQSTDFWVNFKLFGFVPLTFVFAALQYPLLMRHAAEPATVEK